MDERAKGAQPPEDQEAFRGPTDDATTEWVASASNQTPPPPVGPRTTVSPAEPSNSHQWPVIPGFDVLGEVGRGGMGVVYRGRQRSLNRLVALKMIHPVDETSAEALARFQKEAELAASLQHPHIVQVFDVRWAEGSPVLVMELVDGCSLSRRCAGRPQPPVESVRLVELLARAIQEAHRQGIIHRDLKPSNILLTRDGMPKIADFGLAKRLLSDQRLTLTGAAVGTPCYMPPEQALARHDEVGPPADIYALGGVLYELLTGRSPLRRDRGQSLEELVAQQPVPPSQLQRNIDPSLERICMKCLHKDPAERFATAQELADELAGWLAQEKARRGEAAASTTQKDFIKWPGRPLWVAITFGLLLLPVSWVGFSISQRDMSAAISPDEVVREATATLAVRVWEPQQQRYHDLVDRVPLMSGDELRIEAELPSGMHGVLLLLDSQGQLHQLGPPVRERFVYPDRGQSVPLVGSPGTELVLLCSRRSGPPRLEEVQALLKSVEPWPLLPEQSVLEMDQYEVRVVQQDRALGDPIDRPDPEGEVRERLERLRGELVEHFECFYGVAFAHREPL